jgi:Helix-turn-helix domain
MTTMTQAQKVLNYLQKGNNITAKKALSRFKIQKLSARIFELRQEGHDIVSTAMPNTGRGNPRVKYTLNAKGSSKR